MKKFIKFKIDHSEITNRTSPSAVPDPPPSPNLSNITAKINTNVQPPLPLDPPPDTPANQVQPIQVKQEVEDLDYGTCNNLAEFEPESSQRTEVTQKSMEQSKTTICRYFNRGTCKREGNCSFAHKYDVSQRLGLYTFCHKYQNSVCTYANCKYVHASVFEERNFYRTGILPPHAFAHHRRVYVLQPPPPPPPEEPPAVQPITFSYPPPPIPNEFRLEKPILSCVPVNCIENRSLSDSILLRSTSPIKRTWNTVEEYENNLNKVRMEEHVIKFRPSPNFKNMKKFIKSKIDHSEITNRTSPSAVPDFPPANLSSKAAKMNSEVQPPLPLDPPPDTPANQVQPIQVKQEVEDLDYGTCHNSAEFEPESSQRTEVSQKRMEQTKTTICRDFNRGTCKREGYCKFAHIYDVSQRVRLYTFCHKYQNSVCTYANCKYVHASVFEERNFYRTGILPPHAFAHHRREYVLQPPPPPPPEEPPAVQPITFSYPPPPIPNEFRLEKPILSFVPVNCIENRSLSDRILLGSTNPIKRTWNTVEECECIQFLLINIKPISLKETFANLSSMNLLKPIFGLKFISL